MALSRREDDLSRILGSYLAGAVGYSVTVYRPGGFVKVASSGTTAELYPDHGFTGNERVIVGTDATKYRTINLVVGNTVTFNAAVAVSLNDPIVNLGADSGGIAPAYDGSPVAIYSNPDGSTTIPDSTVTTGNTGNFGYWRNTSNVWELVRDPQGAVERLILATGSGGGGGLGTLEEVEELPDVTTYENDFVLLLQPPDGSVLYARGRKGNDVQQWDPIHEWDAS